MPTTTTTTTTPSELQEFDCELADCSGYLTEEQYLEQCFEEFMYYEQYEGMIDRAQKDEY